jgi:hypothetical protein
MGFNEAAGYGAVAITAWLAGYLAANHGLRPAPFLLGLSYALIGLALSVVLVRETRDYARLEAGSHPSGTEDDAALSDRDIFVRTSFTEPALSSASQAGLVNNLNFGLSWGLFPLLFAGAGLAVDRIGLLIAVYPAQAPDHRRDAHPGGGFGVGRDRSEFRVVAGGRSAARGRHGDGVSDPVGGHR